MHIRSLLPGLFMASLSLVGVVGYSMTFHQPRSSSLKGRQGDQSTAKNGAVHEIRGLKVDGDYEMYGPQFDNLTLTGATITGSLKIDGVQNLTIRESHLRNVWFRDRFATQTVLITHNEISMAPGDCVHLFDGQVAPVDVTISENSIHDCGLAHPDSNLYHAVYDQVPDVVLRGNCIANARSALSVRSSGTVEDNLIQNLRGGGGIEYFHDHNAMPGSRLVIAGNTVVSLLENVPGATTVNRGLIILGNDIGRGTRPVSDYMVHDNIVAVLNKEEQRGNGKTFDVYEQGDHPDAKFANNTFINLIPDSAYIGPYKTVGNESGDIKTHDPTAVSKIVLTRPSCRSSVAEIR